MKRSIAPSELILNSDGSIYHLNLLPEDLANIVLTVGDPGRVERVSRHFDEIELRKSKREFVTHTGRLNGKRLSVISTGIGPDNIDIVINELDALVNIDFETRQPKAQKTPLSFVRIGTSGGLQPDIPAGSMIASRFGLGFDNLMHFYEKPNTLTEASLSDELQGFFQYSGRPPVMPYVSTGSPALLQLFSDIMIPGITLTAPGFYAPQGRQLRLKSRLRADFLKTLANFSFEETQVTNFEMETSALYGLAALLGHKAMSCNVLLVNRPKNEVVEDSGAAEAQLIQQVLNRIVHYNPGK